MMARLACRLARREGALSLVTGESLGQVASQTMENIRSIADASDLPILRPLIGFDKTEAIDLARRIGTYDISIRPQPDSCTVFQPRKPAIKTTPEELRNAEAALDVAGLLDESFANLDEHVFSADPRKE
jgi:thiamine biosynthesis protein ThiI